jgi:transposase
MRGDDPQQAAMFSYISPADRVPQAHPLRVIRVLVDAVLKELSPQFNPLDASTGRPSIAPEKLLRALRLQVLYTVRRERLLRDQLDDNLLVRWFVGLNMDDPSWDASTFSKNRERWLEGDVARAVFDQVLAQARERKRLADEHCTVDGTLIAAGAGQKRFKRKSTEVPSSPPDDAGNPSIDFRGERRTNATHTSTTDPEARLDKKAKGPEAKLAYLGHVLMENRHGLVVDTRVTQATGTAEREAALAMAEEIPGQPRVTMGADKNYDTRDCIRELRELRVTPPVAQNPTGRSSAIDGRTTAPSRLCGESAAAQLHRRGLRLAQDRVGSPEWAGCARVPPRCPTWSGCARWRRWQAGEGRHAGKATPTRRRSRSSGGCTVVGCPTEPPFVHQEFCWPRGASF